MVPSTPPSVHRKEAMCLNEGTEQPALDCSIGEEAMAWIFSSALP